MLFEEGAAEPGAQVFGAGVEDADGFVQAVVGVVGEEDGEDLVDAGEDVAVVAGVVDEDAVSGEGDGVVGRWGGKRQAIVAGEHAGRAGGQRVEGVGFAWERALAGGEAEVEAAE